ncbi:DUF3990 domain-containing protein [Bacteroides sp. 51]|uniref:DUF3990 domain-containing protein n=1 Tax=Bacteroides sp. 51 TaxID=2302938 RepID=UPI001EF2FA97|nr:DUF3990 domain-containing protein [Bacteroides sp. 51]
MEINSIDLLQCQVGKDFGCGFYLTDFEAQAKDMAVRRVKLARKGTPVVTSYFFDETLLNDGTLSVKRFEIPTEEWALFILANRNNEERKNNHVYDVVIGPVADDGVAFQLERYEQGLIELDILVKELTYRKLNNQYFFGTEKAILKLNKRL